jgi:pyruvate/2-oxoglutarate dehydrogenase complex dihydrolipoamide dehydrogenase (E3) component
MAQAFRRFGSDVTLLQRGAHLLAKEEPEAAALIETQFEREGIHIVGDAQVVRAEASDGGKRVVVSQNGRETVYDVDEVLIAVGRAPNVEGLELAAAGVEHNARGVIVDDHLRTTNAHILAAGDIAGSYQFTHAADAMARIGIQNAFFFGRKRLSQLVIPRTTYTHPEVASIGLTAAECQVRGIAIDTYREDLARVDRALLDGELQGFALIHCRRGAGRIVGATIVARHAGEMSGELSLLMTKKLPIGSLAGTIHCYPTQVEILKRLGDQFNRTRLTPRVAGWLKWILRWR